MRERISTGVCLQGLCAKKCEGGKEEQYTVKEETKTEWGAEDVEF